MRHSSPFLRAPRQVSTRRWARATNEDGEPRALGETGRGRAASAGRGLAPAVATHASTADARMRRRRPTRPPTSAPAARARWTDRVLQPARAAASATESHRSTSSRRGIRCWMNASTTRTSSPANSSTAVAGGYVVPATGVWRVWLDWRLSATVALDRGETKKVHRYSSSRGLSGRLCPLRLGSRRRRQPATRLSLDICWTCGLRSPFRLGRGGRPERRSRRLGPSGDVRAAVRFGHGDDDRGDRQRATRSTPRARSGQGRSRSARRPCAGEAWLRGAAGESAA